MSDRYPLMLYRDGTQCRVWDAYDVDTRIVLSDEEEGEALKGGWLLTPDYRSRLDHDGDGKPGGSIDGWDQFSDEDLREALIEQGVTVHHKTGRARMLAMLRGEREAV